MKLHTGLLLLSAALSCGLSLHAAEANPASTADRLGWWRAARFGLFIHWGPVSLKGTEIGWSRGGERRGYGSRGTEIPVEVYDNLYKQFNPTNFNADTWVATAQAAGMNYLVFTSRHHDGFSEFDTQADDYKITSPESPFRRDVVKALADACHRAGLRFGLYYSQPNWHHPDAFTDRHTNYQCETVILPNIPRKILRSSALTGGTARVQQAAGTISINIGPPAVRPPARGAELLRPQDTPRANQPQIDSIVKLNLDGSAMDLEPL